MDEFESEEYNPIFETYGQLKKKLKRRIKKAKVSYQVGKISRKHYRKQKKELISLFKENL